MRLNKLSGVADRLRILHASELGVKLVWITVFRTVTTTLLLSAFAVRLFSQPATDELVRQNTFPFVLIGSVYLLTVIFGLILRGGKVGKGAASSTGRCSRYQ